MYVFRFFFSSRRRHTRWPRDWSSDVCSSDLEVAKALGPGLRDSKVLWLSIAAGVQAADLARWLGGEAAVVRAKIGRASCRERGEVSGGGGRLEEKREERVH